MGNKKFTMQYKIGFFSQKGPAEFTDYKLNFTKEL